MRIAEVIGTVTLSRVHPSLAGYRWRPFDRVERPLYPCDVVRGERKSESSAIAGGDVEIRTSRSRRRHAQIRQLVVGQRRGRRGAGNERPGLGRRARRHAG